MGIGLKPGILAGSGVLPAVSGVNMEGRLVG